RRCMQPEPHLRRIAVPDTLEELVESSQRYQSRVIVTHVEHYRRRRFAPANGAHVFMFADFWPAITWSVVEYDRTPKLAYVALQRSMAPLQAMLATPWAIAPGERFQVPAFVVNDTRDPVPGARVRVSAGAMPVAEFSVDLPANAVVELGDVAVVGPPAGELCLHVHVLDSDGE